jgi:hypothetical protein
MLPTYDNDDRTVGLAIVLNLKDPNGIFVP